MSYTVSVGDVLDNSLSGGGLGVYIWCDTNRLILYIGKSVDVIRRLQQHVGNINNKWLVRMDTTIGGYARAMEPESRDWCVEVLGVSDCAEYLSKFYKRIRESGNLIIVEAAEERLIKELRPCLNRTHNPNPQGLPSRYMERFWTR